MKIHIPARWKARRILALIRFRRVSERVHVHENFDGKQKDIFDSVSSGFMCFRLCAPDANHPQMGESLNRFEISIYFAS